MILIIKRESSRSRFLQFNSFCCNIICIFIQSHRNFCAIEKIVFFIKYGHITCSITIFFTTYLNYIASFTFSPTRYPISKWFYIISYLAISIWECKITNHKVFCIILHINCKSPSSLSYFFKWDCHCFLTMHIIR